MATIDELKGLMLQIGIKDKIVNALDPAKAIALQGIDSIDCPAFAVALEERFGVKIADKDALKLKTLNDYQKFLKK